MANRNNSSQTARVLAALNQGKTLTARQIANKFGAGNPHEVIRRLREEGEPIYSNINANGIANYRLGTPRKSNNRIAYRVFGANALR